MKIRRQYPFNEDYFSSIDTPAKAYWLGFIVADGNLRKIPSQVLAINLKGSDWQHLKLFQKCLGRKAPLCTAISNFNTEVTRFQVSSKKIVNDLLSQGVRYKKSKIQKPIVVEHQTDFWRGVFDGDGSIHKKGKYWHISLCGNKFIVDGFYDFLVDNNLPVGRIGKHASIYKWTTGGTYNPYTILKFLYANSTIGLGRKIKLANKIIRDYESGKIRNRLVC
jgi:hypothetical protein